jgi:hypothetical protein
MGAYKLTAPRGQAPGRRDAFPPNSTGGPLCCRTPPADHWHCMSVTEAMAESVPSLFDVTLTMTV